MKPEEIKVGETYNVRVKVEKKSDLFIHTKTGVDTYFCGDYLFEYAEAEAFSPINSANGTKSAKNTQKYDPCRKFREGDIVEPCSVKGRWLSEAWKNRTGIHFTVMEDEDEDGFIWVKDPDRIHQDCGDCVYFQLVTPVEEQELYSVRDSAPISGFDIMRAKMLVMTFPYGPKEAGYYRNELAAKEAAEAECARLNAEYRKACKNG